MTKPGYEKRARAAVERLDVLEDDLPRETCHARGCDRSALYIRPGRWMQLHLCHTHRSLYKTHDQILARIRSLPKRDIV